MKAPCHLTPRQRRPITNYSLPQLIQHLWKKHWMSPTLTMSNHRQKLTSIDAMFSNVTGEETDKTIYLLLWHKRMQWQITYMCKQGAAGGGWQALRRDTIPTKIQPSAMTQSSSSKPSWESDTVWRSLQCEVETDQKPHLFHSEHCPNFCSHPQSFLWLTSVTSFAFKHHILQVS